MPSCSRRTPCFLCTVIENVSSAWCSGSPRPSRAARAQGARTVGLADFIALSVAALRRMRPARGARSRVEPRNRHPDDGEPFGALDEQTRMISAKTSRSCCRAPIDHVFVTHSLARPCPADRSRCFGAARYHQEIISVDEPHPRSPSSSPPRNSPNCATALRAADEEIRRRCRNRPWWGRSLSSRREQRGKWGAVPCSSGCPGAVRALVSRHYLLGHQPSAGPSIKSGTQLKDVSPRAITCRTSDHAIELAIAFAISCTRA